MDNGKPIGPIPPIGYGTWNRAGDEAYRGVIAALETGYRLIDTAEGYRNEEFVGKAIASIGRRAGVRIGQSSRRLVRSIRPDLRHAIHRQIGRIQ